MGKLDSKSSRHLFRVSNTERSIPRLTLNPLPCWNAFESVERRKTVLRKAWERSIDIDAEPDQQTGLLWSEPSRTVQEIAFTAAALAVRSLSGNGNDQRDSRNVYKWCPFLMPWYMVVLGMKSKISLVRSRPWSML
jgi:hypothetical protein